MTLVFPDTLTCTGDETKEHKTQLNTKHKYISFGFLQLPMMGK